MPSRSARMAIPWSPMGPESSTRSPGRTSAGERRTPSGTSPMPVVLMNTPSPLPFSTTLVSPVTISTGMSSAARPIDSATPPPGPGGRPPHPQIVHRAIPRQRSDVAAAKEQRLNHEGIRREGEPRAPELQYRLVVQPVEDRAVKERPKDIAQQLGAEPASRAMAQHDAILHRQRQGTSELDGAAHACAPAGAVWRRY